MDWLKLTPEEEKILWKAAEEPSILEVFNQGLGLDLIKKLREKLLEIFPEISRLPKRYALDNKQESHILPPASADLWVAMALKELRRENKRPN